MIAAPICLYLQVIALQGERHVGRAESRTVVGAQHCCYGVPGRGNADDRMLSQMVQSRLLMMISNHRFERSVVFNQRNHRKGRELER